MSQKNTKTTQEEWEVVNQTNFQDLYITVNEKSRTIIVVDLREQEVVNEED